MSNPDGKYLAYLSPASKTRHGSDGVLYVHSWPTGTQELVFINHQHAADWAAAEGAELMNVPKS